MLTKQRQARVNHSRWTAQVGVVVGDVAAEVLLHNVGDQSRFVAVGRACFHGESGDEPKVGQSPADLVNVAEQEEVMSCAGPVEEADRSGVSVPGELLEDRPQRPHPRASSDEDDGPPMVPQPEEAQWSRGGEPPAWAQVREVGGEGPVWDELDDELQSIRGPRRTRHRVEAGDTGTGDGELRELPCPERDRPV